MPFDATYLLQLALNGLMLGLIYALIAVGLSLIFGVLDIINFAHGEVLMVGAFVMSFALGAFTGSSLPSVLVTLAASAVLGLVLWLYYGIGKGPGQGWMHAKLAIVVLLLGYHHGCGAILRKFEAGTMQRSHVWFRWFNEAPVLMMLAAVCLVVVKPF